MELFEPSHLLPKVQIRVNETLDIKIFVYNWSLPKDHIIYEQHSTLEKIFLSDLLKLVAPYKVCKGVGSSVEPSKIHSVPLEVTESVAAEDSSIVMRRSPECFLLSADETYTKCSKYEKQFFAKLEKSNAYNKIPAKPQAPHSTTNPQKLILGLKQRLEAEKRENRRLQRESIEKHGISSSQFGSGLESLITNAMTANQENLTPFVKLFWEEQTKYNSMGSVRYHPMIIRFALSLAIKSPAAYEELRKSGIMILPCRRTLRDYKNAITPSTGFNPGVIAELRKMCQDLNDLEKFVVLSFDEVKIQSNLIFDKHSGRIIGFVDFGDEDINTGTLTSVNNVATHVMSFHLRTFLGHVKFHLGFFATEGALSFQIYPLFWKAVGLLEMSCNLQVIGAVCDGASPNRKFFKMHSKIDGSGKHDVTYRTTNLYDRSRFIWFFSDYPHLMKTSRNWLENDFLKYFADWEKSIAARTGFEEKEKEKMFISRQTMEGIKITVHSVVECVKFLLSCGMEYVLTERFTQDLLELYFGLQRACGASNDNPTVQQFGWNDSAIRARGELAKARVEGNTKGGQKKHKHSWYAVNDEPLPKRSKKTKK